MPNEPEKPIEPALHAYAQQRREAAGAPLELHPATRQLLQGEVARTLAQPADKTPSRFQFLLSAWPRLAFGGAIFATLVFVMVLMQSGNHVGPGESIMTLAKHTAEPAAQTESRKLRESPVAGEKEAKDRDEAPPMPTASILTQPPPQPMAADRLENIQEAKTDSYARSAPLPASTPTMPRNFKPTEPANQSRAEMSRQDFSFKVKAETAEAKVNGTTAATVVAGGASNAKNLSRESFANGQAGEKQPTTPQRKLGAIMEPQTKPADKMELPSKPQARAMRMADSSRPSLADDKRPAPAGAPAEAAQLMKLAERDVKQTVAKSAAMPAATPLPAFQPATPAKKLPNDPTKETATVANSARASGDLRLSFAQEDSRARFRQNLNSPPVPNVLTSFQIERTGNAIRIIDADGSTYAGQIIPGIASASLLYADDESGRLADAAQKELREKSLEKNIPQRGTPALAGNIGKAQTANFSFHASGTNQSLNQSVEFFGTLVLDPEITQSSNTTGLAMVKAKTAASAPVSGPQTNVVLNQADFLRGRIQGQAVVGGKNRFEINAVPATK